MSAQEVAIVDCGGANIASLTNALDRLDCAYSVTTDAARIQRSSHVIIPGVGHAADAMRRLHAKELTDTIQNLTQPVLGICLGMQLLARASAEDNAECLGILDVQVEKLSATRQLPVPNIGWCQVSAVRDHWLLTKVDDCSYFYFVHSYVVPNGSYTIATANHVAPFTAILEKDNFLATQFHPERSAAAGAKVLENFLSSTQ